MGARKPLSAIVAEKLADGIGSGALAPGAQLPTEAELCAEHQVSRTVVREAIARLRSEGLVVPQQGRGVFVSETPARRGFTIPPDMLKTLPETVALLELRLSVETESAGLCAERRSDEQAGAIRALMEQVDARREDPASVEIHYDYDFHLSIAQASGNAFMHGFLQYLRPMIVPRYQLGYVVSSRQKEAYYRKIHDEHVRIVDAIERRDAEGARRAMRRHLTNSLSRLRALAENSGVDAARSEQTANAAALFESMRVKSIPQ